MIERKIRNLSIPPTFLQRSTHGFVIRQPVLVIFIIEANEADIRVGLRKSYGASSSIAEEIKKGNRVYMLAQSHLNVRYRSPLIAL